MRMQLPATENLPQQKLSFHSELKIIAANISQGQSLEGVAHGPENLINSNLSKLLSTKFFEIDYFKGTENRFPFLRNKDLAYYNLYKRTKKVVSQQAQTLILGGDHSLSLATIPAIQSQHPGLKVLWVDAHGDINTPKTSPTGNLHGMPVAALLGLFDFRKYKGWNWFHPCLKPEDICFVGVRDLDPGEEKIMKSHGIRVYSSADVRNDGMDSVIDEALHYLNPDHSCPLHVSFDVDVIDPKLAPATGVPVPKGLSLQEAIDLADYVRCTQDLVSLEIVEFNPEAAQHNFEVSLTRSCIERVIQNFF